MLGVALVVATTVTLTSGLIIPEELPSLLSLVYSNIPPIKKGTDSRVGFGFRLGPHADFQVLLEVGPQSNTAAIGPDAPASGKRETLQMHNTDTLVSMVNTWKMPLPQIGESEDKVNSLESDSEKVPETTGGKWLDNWKNTVNRESFFGKIKFKPVPGIDSRNDRWHQPYFTQRQPNYQFQLQRLWKTNT